MTERITENEARLDKALACVRKLEDALAGFTANEADLQRLNEYYGSADWHADKEAFESNAIPRVKAGVLSEDAVWNLNEDISSLREAMQEVLSAAPARTDRGLWIRPYIHARDFAIIQDWIGDERTHALWSANRIAFPLTKEGFGSLLRDIAEQFGDSPFIAADSSGKAVGFFCYSLNPDTNEGMLKFIMTNPDLRGNGYGHEMISLALHYAFAITKAHAVHLNVFSCNEAAKRCYQKAGFTERSVAKHAFRFRDESWDRCNMIIPNKDVQYP